MCSNSFLGTQQLFMHEKHVWCLYSCIDIYLYSCFNPLSNERKSMFESGYIQELFEHWFKLEKTNALSYLHVVKIHYIESNADQTDRFADAFVRENAGYSYDVVTTL